MRAGQEAPGRREGEGDHTKEVGVRNLVFLWLSTAGKA